jgi:hypothetical protein
MLQPRAMKHATLKHAVPVLAPVLAALVLALGLAACAPEAPTAAAPAPEAAVAVEQPAADVFLARLNALCGQRFVGKLVTTDPADADMASARLLMQVRDCSPTEVRIPFHVGADTSRTWVLTRTEQGLRLKHDHRHEDGTEDELSQYGGDTAAPGTPTRQEFPADAFSKELFETKGNPASVTNVWAVEADANLFAYELRRPNRFFRVEFDLANPVAE